MFVLVSVMLQNEKDTLSKESGDGGPWPLFFAIYFVTKQSLV
jgi:hypothetical protein